MGNVRVKITVETKHGLTRNSPPVVSGPHAVGDIEAKVKGIKLKKY